MPDPSLDHLSAIAARLQLPPAHVSLARAILRSTNSNSHDPYTAACAVYIATVNDSHKPPPLFSGLLRAPGSQLHINQFFDTAKAIATEPSTPTPLPPPLDHTRLVNLSHHAFMVCAKVWRKLTDLFDADVLHSFRDASRLAWLFFLVCKAHLTNPVQSSLPDVDAFHLLLASLIEAGLVLPTEHPVRHLCRLTKALPSQINTFRDHLKAALPPTFRHALPFYRREQSASMDQVCRNLSQEYDALLATPSHRNSCVERVFIDLPHVESHLPSPLPSSSLPPSSTPSPRKRSRLSDHHSLTPRKRQKSRRTLTPLTPDRCFRSDPAARPDALDALAAVASTAPPSPAVNMRLPPSLPATPMTAGLAAVTWLDRLAESRPETSSSDSLSCPPHQLPTTDKLKHIISDNSVWVIIVEAVRKMTEKLEVAMPHITTADRKRQAHALYFYAVESILVKEATRLAARKELFTEKLLKNMVFHNSILTYSWELTAAARGKRDMAVFSAAMKAVNVSPFEITKAMESFIRRLPDMPRSLSEHILTCDARLLESLAWRQGSELVSVLHARSIANGVPAQGEETANGTENSNEGSTDDNHNTNGHVPMEVRKPHNVKEFPLEIFFKKMLALASDRLQELLSLLDMDAITEAVWACVKHSVWEKWNLMVDRHLDQIIMCCVYGVAKVQCYELKFKKIINLYRRMSHVREPSFVPLVPGVFRDMSLDPHLGLRTGSAPAAVQEERGDIIRFYNLVFIPVMKAQLLGFRVNTGMRAGNLVANGASGDSGAVSSAGQGSASSSISIGNQERNLNDALKDKVLSSPMRVLRPVASPRRIGRVTVSPMSPGRRNLAAIRQSPGRNGIPMTPGTRTLYAFGESPVRSFDRINRSLSGSGPQRRPVPLNFDGTNPRQRRASFRKRYADVLKNSSGLRPLSGRIVEKEGGGSNSKGDGS